MSLEFTLVRRAISLAVIDGPDAGDNPDILQAQGSVLFEPVIKKGDSIQVQTRGGSETYALAPIECPINDGIISHRGQDGVKLPAGGEAANPSLIRWKATFSRMQAGGKSFTLAPVIFDAVPGGEIDLTMVAPVAGAPEGVVRGPRGTSLESIIVDGSELVFTAVDDAGSFEIARIPLDDVVRAEAEAAADGVRDALAVDVAASQSARDAAEGHADRAATSESNAATSETNAKQSEDNAGDYAAVATTAATEAVDAMERATDLAGGDFATHEYVDSGLALKADKTYVDAEKWNKGDLGASDLNDVTTPGMWHQRWSAIATPERNYPTKQAGALQVAKSQTLVSQTFTTLSGHQQVWVRYFSPGNVWTAWVLVNQQWGRGQLGLSNLDEVVTAGYYHQQNVASATPDRNYPVNEPGILEVLVNGERILQRYTDMTAPSIQYVRYSVMEEGVRVWRPWERIGLTDSAEIIVEADYTGVSDAQPAIQAAIEKGKTEGKPVRLLAGKLKLNKAITAVDKLVLRGSGMGKTILLPQGQANAIEYKAGTEGEPISDVIFSDFDIDGKDQIMPSNGYAPTQTKGAFIEKMHRIEMRNLHIRNTGATGLGIDHVTGVIENVWAVNCGRFNGGNKPGGSGIGIGTGWLDPVFEPLTIANCHTIGNARFGIFIESQTEGAAPSGITITGCTARGNKDGIGDAGGTGAIITANHVIENTRSGIDVDHGTLSQGAPGLQTKVVANDIRGNATGITIYVKPDRGLDGVQIVDNTIIDNLGDGLYFNADTNDSVSNPVRNLRITGNEISRNLGRGIYIEGDRYISSLILRRFWIARNRVWENADTGIHINGQTDGLVMEGNIIWDDQQEPTQAAAVLVERTHTNLVERENIWGSGSVAIPTA